MLEQKRKKVPIKKEKEKSGNSIDKYKQLAAKWILAYSIHLLWSDKDIYESEQTKTIEYIRKNYLTNVNSFAKIDKRKEEIKWRLEAAARYAKRRNYIIQVFPYRYFDTENKTSGFGSTRKWYKENLQYHIKKLTSKQISADQQELNKSIKTYALSPTISEYKQQEDYINNNFPHLINEFYNHFNNDKF